MSEDLSSYLGDNVGSSRVKEECFNTGQGPYDDGYLWCQSSTIFYLNNEPEPLILGEEFIRVSRSVGKSRQADGYDLPLYLVELSNNAKCYLGIKLSSGKEVSGARRNPFDYHSKDNLVAITCGDLAKAKHYQYID